MKPQFQNKTPPVCGIRSRLVCKYRSSWYEFASVILSKNFCTLGACRCTDYAQTWCKILLWTLRLFLQLGYIFVVSEPTQLKALSYPSKETNRGQYFVSNSMYIFDYKEDIIKDKPIDERGIPENSLKPQPRLTELLL